MLRIDITIVPGRKLAECFCQRKSSARGLFAMVAEDEGRLDKIQEPPQTPSSIGLLSARGCCRRPSPMSLGRSPTVPSHKALPMLVAGPKRSPLPRCLLSPQVLHAWKAGRRGPFSITYKPTTNAPPGHHGLHSVIQDGCATGHGVTSSSGSPRIPVQRRQHGRLGCCWKSQTAATATHDRARSEYLWSTC